MSWFNGQGNYPMMLRNEDIKAIDYGSLNGILPGGMLPSNVDGILHVEQNDDSQPDEFLIVECKNENEQMSVGQIRLLKGFSKSFNFTVVVAELDGSKTAKGNAAFIPKRWQFVIHGSFCEWKPCTLLQFQTWYRRWYDSVKKETNDV